MYSREIKDIFREKEVWKLDLVGTCENRGGERRGILRPK